MNDAGADTNGGDVVPRAVGRVLDLLEIVLDARRCTLSEAAVASGLTPTTARRHLMALEARGYLERDADGVFTAGPTILRIGSRVRRVEPIDELIASAQPYLDDLAEKTGESAYLAVADDRVATYVAAAESRRAIRHVGYVGQTVPLEGSAIGRALATPGSVAVRTGAVESDVTAVSMAIDTSSSLVAGISLVGPSHRFGRAQCEAAETAIRSAIADLERGMSPVDRGVA